MAHTSANLAKNNEEIDKQELEVAHAGELYTKAHADSARAEKALKAGLTVGGLGARLGPHGGAGHCEEAAGRPEEEVRRGQEAAGTAGAAVQCGSVSPGHPDVQDAWLKGACEGEGAGGRQGG